MNLRLLTLASLLTGSTLSSDAPKLTAVAAAKEKQMSGKLRKPAEPTAKKKELLISDDFERVELGKDKDCAIGGRRFPWRTRRRGALNDGLRSRVPNSARPQNAAFLSQPRSRGLAILGSH